MAKPISNEEITPRLFENPILEFFSKVYWYVPIILYLPVVAYFIYIGFTAIGLTYSIIMFLLGMFAWTITEYILHRFVFHYQPKTRLGQKLIFIFHGIHHSYPRDPLRLVMPPSVSIPLAFFFYYLFSQIYPTGYNFAFFAGFVLGYLIYDVTHYAIHHFPIKNKIFLQIKKHHMLHHYQSEQSKFGVSSPLWDYIFGTYKS